jgi:hypothetical protein
MNFIFFIVGFFCLCSCFNKSPTPPADIVSVSSDKNIGSFKATGGEGSKISLADTSRFVNGNNQILPSGAQKFVGLEISDKSEVSIPEGEWDVQYLLIGGDRKDDASGSVILEENSHTKISKLSIDSSIDGSFFTTEKGSILELSSLYLSKKSKMNVCGEVKFVPDLPFDQDIEAVRFPSRGQIIQIDGDYTTNCNINIPRGALFYGSGNVTGIAGDNGKIPSIIVDGGIFLDGKAPEPFVISNANVIIGPNAIISMSNCGESNQYAHVPMFQVKNGTISFVKAKSEKSPDAINKPSFFIKISDMSQKLNEFKIMQATEIKGIDNADRTLKTRDMTSSEQKNEDSADRGSINEDKDKESSGPGSLTFPGEGGKEIRFEPNKDFLNIVDTGAGISVGGPDFYLKENQKIKQSSFVNEKANSAIYNHKSIDFFKGFFYAKEKYNYTDYGIVLNISKKFKCTLGSSKQNISGHSRDCLISGIQYLHASKNKKFKFGSVFYIHSFSKSNIILSKSLLSYKNVFFEYSLKNYNSKFFNSFKFGISF